MMGNKLIIISSQNHRSVNYYKLTTDEQALLRKVWFGVENNPQFHGSSFFLELCRRHPRYTKYFTTLPQAALNFDGRNVAKFTVIMETIGYLVLDYHSKPKQLDQLIGYIAMVHKDMGLHRQDIINFGTCLAQYLSTAFPLSMNDECLDVFTKYFKSILVELALKMEEFLQDERLNVSDDEEDAKEAAMETTFMKTDILDGEQEGNERETLGRSQKTGPTLLMLCGRWSNCRNNLMYGQSLHYWKDRKKHWDKRLKQWTILSAPNHTGPQRQVSSTDDEENSANKSKTEDENTSEMADIRISPPETTQSTFPQTQGVTPNILIAVPTGAILKDGCEVKSELQEFLMGSKLKPKESGNLAYNVSDKIVRGSEIIRLTAVPEDSNETIEESSTPRERRRARSNLRISFPPCAPSSEFQNIKKNITVENKKQGVPQEDEKVFDSPLTRISVQSARERRRESHKSLLH